MKNEKQKRASGADEELSNKRRKDDPPRIRVDGGDDAMAEALDSEKDSWTLFAADEESILQRALGTGPARGVAERWIACVSHQMTCELEKLKATDTGQQRLEAIPHYVDSCRDEHEIMGQIRKWLRQHQDSQFFLGPERKGPGAKLDSKSKTGSRDGAVESETVKKFCLRNYKIKLDEYIAKLETSEAPGYELASFALSRCYDQVRLAVLRPKSIQETGKLAWQIWDSEKAGSKRIMLRIADGGSHHFVSLVPKDDWSTRLAEAVLRSGSSDSMLMADDEADASPAGPHIPLRLDRERHPCRNCGKFRLFRNGTAIGASYLCKDNDMEMEKSCDDPAIFAQIQDFGLRGGYSKKIDKKPLNLSYLFLLVQAAGSLEELIKQRKLTEVAKLLGAQPKTAAAEALRIQKAYESVFRAQKPQKDGGMSLERILQRDPFVIGSLRKKGPKLRKSLGIAENVKHRISEIAEGQQLPDIFGGVSCTPTRSEHITKMMKEVWEAATQWANYAERRSNRRPKWADAVNEIVDQAHKVWCTVRRNDDMALAMLGNTGVGKSFLMDCILRMSESDRAQYADDVGSVGERVGVLEAQEYLTNLNKIPAAAVDESVEACITSEMYEADVGKLRAYCSPEKSDVLEREHDAAAMIAAYCMDADSRADFPSFLLPTFRPTTTTTACAISSRRGRRYQIVLEYTSREELVAEWQQYSKLRNSKKSGAKKRVAIMESQVEHAMGLREESDSSAQLEAKKFLKAFEPSKLAELKELDSVLGKRLGFAGAGLSPLHDRVLIRAILHNAQGLKDDFTHSIDVNPMRKIDADSVTETGYQLMNKSGEERIRFGQRTHGVLKKIVLFAPCDILPVTESEWVDPPGCEDGCPIKRRMLADEMCRAEAVIVLVEKNLKGSDATASALEQSNAFKALINSVREGKQVCGRVSLLCNLEKALQARARKVTPAVLEEHRASGAVSEGQQESMEKLKKMVEDNAGSNSDCAMEDEELNELADKVCDKVQHTVAAFKFATSVVMNTDQRSLDEETREDWLAKTGMYELLGVVEKFLRSGTLRMIQSIKAELDNQVKELAEQQQRLLETSAEPRDAGTNKKAGKNLWIQLEEKAEKDSLLGRMEESILLAFTDVDLADALHPPKSALDKVRTHVKESPFDSDDESDKIDDDTLCDEFAQIVHERTSKPLRAKSKLLKDRLEQVFIDAATPKMQEFVLKHSREYVEQQLHGALDSKDEDSIETLVKEHVYERAKAMATDIHQSTCRRLTMFPRKATAQLKGRLFEQLGERGSVEDRWSVLVENLDWFIGKVRKRIQAGIRCDMELEKTDKKGSPRPIGAFFCKLGLMRWPAVGHISTQKQGSQIRSNSLRKIGSRLAVELEPTARIGQTRDEKEQFKRLVENCQDLQRTLESALQAWETDGDLRNMGKKLVSDFRVLRKMESFAESRACGNTLSNTPAKKLMDEIPIHCDGAKNDGGYVDFRLEELEKAFEDDAEVRKSKINAQLAAISARPSCPLIPHSSNHVNKLLNGTESDSDLLFKIYAGILGHSMSNLRVREYLRDAIAHQALLSANADSKIKRFLDSRHGGVLTYSEKIQRPKENPDLMALVLLVHFFKRPLNLYVPWADNPRRISPLRDPAGSADAISPAADALVLAGWVRPSSRQADSQADQMLIFVPFAEGKQPTLRSSARSVSLPGSAGSLSRGASGASLYADSAIVTEEPETTNVVAGAVMDADAASCEKEEGGEEEEEEGGDEEEEEEEEVIGPDEIQKEASTDSAPPATPRMIYSYATFAASSWTRVGENVRMVKGEALSVEDFRRVAAGFAQFSERFVFCKAARHKRYPGTTLPCDDAFLMYDDVLGVFDGVGAFYQNSGKFARRLALETLRNARTPVEKSFIRLNEKKYNRSESVLDAAVREACRAQCPSDLGSSTAVVLSLIQRNGENQLHSAVIGDSQWVLLRKSGGKYRCQYVSERLYHDGAAHNPVPYQVMSNCPRSLHESSLKKQHMSVQHEDIVLLATDGFFDIFLVGKKTRKAGDEMDPDLEENYTKDLQAKFNKYTMEMEHEYRKQNASSRSTFLKFFADHLSRLMKRTHDSRPSRATDDMTIVLAQVSEGVGGYEVGKKHLPLLDPKQQNRARLLELLKSDAGAESYESMMP